MALGSAGGSGDTHCAVYRGSKSRIEVRRGREEGFRAELYVVPGEPDVRQALTEKVAELAKRYPGSRSKTGGAQARIVTSCGIGVEVTRCISRR